MAKVRKGRRKRRQKQKLDPTERKKRAEQKAQTREVRGIMRNMGFGRLSSPAGRNITYQGVPGEFDDVFLCENIILVVEYTIAQSSNLSSHLKTKKILYDKILSDELAFACWLREQQPTDRQNLFGGYDDSHFKVFVLYCSKNKIESSLKSSVNEVIYLDFEHVKYFKLVTDALRLSARYEFLNFLGLTHRDFGDYITSIAREPKSYDGAALPEFHSKLGSGIKVLSFYAEPDALLRRCYVLRKEGWIDGRRTYQRLIEKSKMASVRRHLIEKRHVFVNNIIVSLPPSTRIIDENNETIPDVTRTRLVRVELPEDFNSIAVIDGQHRVFAYHEGGTQDEKIAPLRQHQNLLVTGIVYPENLSQGKRTRFEAELFLHLNATQTSANSKVKQEIGLLLRPFSNESIARQVVSRLNQVGPLADCFEMRFYERGKLKVPSIVSFGVRYLTRTTEGGGLFRRWKDSEKQELMKEKDEVVLERYVDYCAKEINLFLGAVRSHLGQSRWTYDKEVQDRVLTTTAVNGFITCLRLIAESKTKMSDIELYQPRLANISSIDISSYKSSQYGALGREIYDRCFAT